MELLDYLRMVASFAAAPYQELPQIRGILLVGSAAYGVVDNYSDLDIILYYEELPSEEELHQARLKNGWDAPKWSMADSEQGSVMEAYDLGGVECQFAHCSIGAIEQEMNSILVDLDPDTPNQKALSGLIYGVPLYGEDFIRRLKDRAAQFPYGLAKAMVERFLDFQALWLMSEKLKARDALLWKQQGLLQGAQNILGVLAGLNRVYYSTFQFKRMGEFINELRIRPQDLGRRIVEVCASSDSSIAVYRELVSDVVKLVEDHMPEVDVSAVRRRLDRVEQPWAPEPLPPR